MTITVLPPPWAAPLQVMSLLPLVWDGRNAAGNAVAYTAVTATSPTIVGGIPSLLGYGSSVTGRLNPSIPPGRILTTANSLLIPSGGSARSGYALRMAPYDLDPDSCYPTTASAAPSAAIISPSILGCQQSGTPIGATNNSDVQLCGSVWFPGPGNTRGDNPFPTIPQGTSTQTRTVSGTLTNGSTAVTGLPLMHVGTTYQASGSLVAPGSTLTVTGSGTTASLSSPATGSGTITLTLTRTAGNFFQFMEMFGPPFNRSPSWYLGIVSPTGSGGVNHAIIPSILGPTYPYFWMDSAPLQYECWNDWVVHVRLDTQASTDGLTHGVIEFEWGPGNTTGTFGATLVRQAFNTPPAAISISSVGVTNGSASVTGLPSSMVTPGTYGPVTASGVPANTYLTMTATGAGTLSNPYTGATGSQAMTVAYFQRFNSNQTLAMAQPWNGSSQALYLNAYRTPGMITGAADPVTLYHSHPMIGTTRASVVV